MMVMIIMKRSDEVIRYVSLKQSFFNFKELVFDCTLNYDLDTAVIVKNATMFCSVNLYYLVSHLLLRYP